MQLNAEAPSGWLKPMMIVGIVLTWYDVYSDIMYQVTVPFQNDLLKGTQLFFIIFPFVVILFTYFTGLITKQ